MKLIYPGKIFNGAIHSFYALLVVRVMDAGLKKTL